MLRAIGRRHTAAGHSRRHGPGCAPCGFPHVNMDLIAGLPADTRGGLPPHPGPGAWPSGPDNITVHTLALKKGSRILLEGLRHPHGGGRWPRMLDYADRHPARRRATLPTTSTGRSTCPAALKTWAGAIPGAEGLYNIYIMEELHSILSLGAGGSTKMVDPVRGRIERVFHAKYPTEYIQRPEKIAENLAAFRAFHENMKK